MTQPVPHGTLLIWLSVFLITSTGITTVVNAQPAEIKNVVLIIGDGMDDQQITIARNYLKGVKGRLTLDEMPVRGSVQVLTVEEADPSRPLYVAESAGSGTAISTGVVTSRARIATSAKKDRDLQTIVELAQRSGLKTGLVTTSSVTDATPATFASHIRHRFCEDPELMKFERRGRRIDCSMDLKANGGNGSISEQLAVSDLDILLGGGLGKFLKPAEGSTDLVLTLAEKEGFLVVHSKRALVNADKGERLLGLFATDHLPTKWRGERGRLAERPQIDQVKLEVNLPPPMICEDNPLYQSTPSLQLMTRKALEHLTYNNEKGFFLMIESASIDKQSHARNPCGSIGELAQLDETLKFVFSFAESHPQTLVLVTADHGQAAQIIPNGSLFIVPGLPISTPGRMARIRMPNGGVMAVNYATNGFVAEEHTGVAVPLYANDVGTGLFKPLILQQEIFVIMRSFLGL